jgi:hypothetical protein
MCRIPDAGRAVSSNGLTRHVALWFAYLLARTQTLIPAGREPPHTGDFSSRAQAKI